MEMILMVALFIGVFYFLMIRPEQKRKKTITAMREALQAGDEIVTIGGLVGKVIRVQDDFVTFETGEDRVRLKIVKWGISTRGRAAGEQTDQAQQQS